VVEIVDPICLGVKVVDKGHPCHCCCSVDSIPEHIHNHVRGQIIEDGDKELVVTLGIFAIIRLERPAQIVVPCTDFCIPEKECPPVNEDDPCKLFKKMKFPVNEFFPQSLSSMGFSDDTGCGESEHHGHGRPNCRK
jgi:hypothetical protein